RARMVRGFGESISPVKVLLASRGVGGVVLGRPGLDRGGGVRTVLMAARAGDERDIMRTLVFATGMCGVLAAASGAMAGAMSGSGLVVLDTSASGALTM